MAACRYPPPAVGSASRTSHTPPVHPSGIQSRHRPRLNINGRVRIALNLGTRHAPHRQRRPTDNPRCPRTAGRPAPSLLARNRTTETPIIPREMNFTNKPKQAKALPARAGHTNRLPASAAIAAPAKRWRPAERYRRKSSLSPIGAAARLSPRWLEWRRDLSGRGSNSRSLPTSALWCLKPLIANAKATRKLRSDVLTSLSFSMRWQLRGG